MTKDILVLKGHGLDLRVSYGGLKIKDGFPHKAEINESFINRGLNDVDHLVILGFSGSITFEAIKWIIDQNIIVTFCDYEGNIITSFMPEKHISGVVKRRQATANDELKLKISAWLLSEKFKEQRKTLTWLQNSFYNVSWWDNEREKRINQATSISKDREKVTTQLFDK